MSPSSGAEPSARLSTSPLQGRCVSSVLAPLSGSYPPPEGRLPMHYSPVCHFTTVLRRLLVRLACVRRAASVRSEPGSNSRKENLETSLKGRHFNTPVFSCQRTNGFFQTSNVTETRMSCQELHSPLRAPTGRSRYSQVP